MKVTKFVIFIIMLSVVAGFAVAQAEPTPPAPAEQEVGAPDFENIGVDSAQQSLKEISVSKLEDPAFFRSAMSGDEGYTLLRRLPGSPAEKTPIAAEQEAGIKEADDHVLGVKVSYLRRGVNSFGVVPVKPLPIPGIAKTISVWVAGRNTENELTVILMDYFNQPKELYLGSLNFSGWKKLTVAIPPEIVQRDYHYPNVSGLKFNGFRVHCDPEDTYGVYYVYFDDLRAVTDLFTEENRDYDDMTDGW